MILGADVFRLLFSVEGIIYLVAIAAIWIATRNSRAARRFLFAVVVFYVLVSTLVFPYIVAKQLARGFHPFRASDLPAGSRTAIVVLGTGSVTVGDWWGENYSVVDRTGARRVLEAAHVYKLVHAQYVIASGGDPHPSRRRAPSGETMRESLVELGVPAARILVETKSQTTRDEAVIVVDMLKPLAVDRVVLVTSESHMRRAMGTFRAVGLDCVPAIAAEFDWGSQWWRQWLPTADGLDGSAVIAHEVLGLAYYAMHGWFSR